MGIMTTLTCAVYGHKLSPIMINGTSLCDRCDKFIPINECSQAAVDDAVKRAEIEYPSMSYSGQIPKTYCCSKCKIHGVKLWRGYNEFEPTLLCVDCAEKRENKKLDLDKCDQIGWQIPAVPTEDGIGYWGYTSVPENGVNWWKALPLRTVDLHQPS